LGQGESLMVQIPERAIALEEFLALPETKPASEYINGQVIQKPMPQGKHSKLQGKLVTAINQVVEDKKNCFSVSRVAMYVRWQINCS